MKQQRMEKIISQTMEEVMHNSMMPYAEYVILERALPRVEDGLKPVQRRILYTMNELSMWPDKPHRKAARIVGDTLGKYHPHGDTSVYDAMVRMAQPFNMQAPLVDGHGNFGSMDGDSAAAMRYTEARMTPLALEMLRDIDKDTVPHRLNFDDTLYEPDILPSRYPNLLVNGATGIAVGLATNIPPHNLGETIDGVIAQINDPEISLNKLMRKIKGPDFPTGGYLMDATGLESAYSTGRGKVVVRAKTHIEELKNGKSLIIVSELPYQVNKANALAKILALSEEKKLLFSGIADIRDESDRTGIRAVIEVRKDGDPQKILNYLYKYSDLQINFSINMVAIADGKPQQMGLKQLIGHYIDHQKQVVTRRTKYDLEAAEKRMHILEGLIIAIDNIDRVIAIIRGSKTADDAKKQLMAEFKLSDIQAQAILDMRLRRLVNLQILELRREYEDIQKLIVDLKAILASEQRLLEVIKAELLEIKKKYAVPRRTELNDESCEIEIDSNDLKVVDDALVLITLQGIKRMNGRGAKQEGERVLFELNTQTDRRIQLFTNYGTMYSIGIEEIPEARGKDRAVSPAGLLAGWQDNERIVAAFEFADYNAGDLLFFTKNGMVKRSALLEYNTRNKKITACNLKDGDELVSVAPDTGEESVILITKAGMSIRFAADSVPNTGRATGGVKGMDVMGDEIVFAMQLRDEGELLIITDRGYAKRTLICDFEPQGRNGKGQKALDLKKNGANGGAIAAVLVVREPYTFYVLQHHGERSAFFTEDVLIEARTSKGSPLVMAIMDNIVVDAYK